MDPQQAQLQALRIFSTMVPLIGLFMLVAVALYIIPLWQICKKAGLSAPLSLIALIPGSANRSFATSSPSPIGE